MTEQHLQQQRMEHLPTEERYGEMRERDSPDLLHGSRMLPSTGDLYPGRDFQSPNQAELMQGLERQPYKDRPPVRDADRSSEPPRQRLVFVCCDV